MMLKFKLLSKDTVQIELSEGKVMRKNHYYLQGIGILTSAIQKVARQQMLSRGKFLWDHHLLCHRII
jgi:hypothetical protein